MKIYTMWTDSHEKLYKDFFLKYLPSELELVSIKEEQECPTGEFNSDGWQKSLKRKIDIFLKAVEENWGGYFIFSDCDIQFFGNIKNELILELADNDIACQHDTSGYFCSGFFICRANENTKNMFQAIKDNYGVYAKSPVGDQAGLNDKIHMVKNKLLSNRFWTVGMALHNRWTNQDFSIDKSILMHHANWTVGVDSKYELLKKVREKYKALNG